jgi:hypothetical protein
MLVFDDQFDDQFDGGGNGSTPRAGGLVRHVVKFGAWVEKPGVPSTTMTMAQPRPKRPTAT